MKAPTYGRVRIPEGAGRGERGAPSSERRVRSPEWAVRIPEGHHVFWRCVWGDIKFLQEASHSRSCLWFLMTFVLCRRAIIPLQYSPDLGVIKLTI